MTRERKKSIRETHRAEMLAKYGGRIEPETVELLDGSTLRYEYSGIRLPSLPWSKLLVVRVWDSGDAREMLRTDESRLIQAVVTAGVIRWNPLGLILDVRDIDHHQGDDFEFPYFVGIGHYARGDLRTAIVASDENRASILDDLTRHELAPKSWLFGTVEAAVKAMDDEVSDQATAQ